ncbi:uncharacterized protein LOC110977231 isoform X2 [Acanthaster planci]|uniref:Uncharacterized protein LOC110977231 isoform X2 n=1 Tax=Acanthaster planci TaxID=133434 RepID=A0A8B7Y3H2_ACAPL|nr:uncharacterized protein LOC110977231 isoform X2 [Acanthaster planci]
MNLLHVESAVVGLLLYVTSFVGVDGPPTGLALQANDIHPQDVCSAYDEYRDEDSGECEICIKCNPGFGSTAIECGYGRVARKGKCEPCQPGSTYQANVASTESCQPCRLCDENAVVVSLCNVTHNTVCGSCKPGYGSDPNHKGSCSRCTLFNDDDRPEECQTFPVPTEPPTTSPSPPLQPPTTEVHPTTVDIPLVTTVESPTTSTPLDPGKGRSSVEAWKIAVPVSFSAFIILLVVCFLWWRKGSKRQHTEGQNSTDREEGTAAAAEMTSLTTSPSDGDPSPATPPSATPNGGLSDQELQLGSTAEIHPNGSPPVQQVPPPNVPPVEVNENENGTALPGENVDDTEPDSHSGECTPNQACSPGLVQDDNESLENSVHTSAGCDYADSRGSTKEHAPRVVSSHLLPSIPEKMNGMKSSADKKFKHVKKCAAKTRQRSLSDQGRMKSPPSSPEILNNGADQPMLDTAVRENINNKKKKKEEKDYQMNLSKACSIGSWLHWVDLSSQCRKTVLQMLTPGGACPSISTYKELGEALGLRRDTELRTCKDINNVFDTLATRQEVTLEDILLCADKIERKDVVKVICKEVLQKP